MNNKKLQSLISSSIKIANLVGYLSNRYAPDTSGFKWMFFLTPGNDDEGHFEYELWEETVLLRKCDCGYVDILGLSDKEKEIFRSYLDEQSYWIR